MAPRSLQLYLSDIRQACQRVGKFSTDKTLSDFEDDLLFRSAMERRLTIIGEAMRAAIRIDPSLADTLPESGRIIAFRNVLVHHYFEIEEDVVWVIVTQRVPELLAVVSTLLNDEPPASTA